MINNISRLCCAAVFACSFALFPCVQGRAQSGGNSNIDKKLDTPFASFRIGIIASPAASIDTGLDVTFPRFRIGKSWATRVDVDLTARFASPSFGSRRDAQAAATLCQVYTPGGLNRGRLFMGAGLGPSFGPKSGLGAKVFAGVNFSPVVSLSFEAQFIPGSEVRTVGMLRLAAL